MKSSKHNLEKKGEMPKKGFMPKKRVSNLGHLTGVMYFRPYDTGLLTAVIQINFALKQQP